MPRMVVLALLLTAGLAMAVVPPGGAQGEAALELTDGTGDAYREESEGTGVQPPVPLPANAFMDAFDVTALRVLGDDAENVEMTIQVVDLDADVRSSDPQGSYRYFVRFQVVGAPVFYEAMAFSGGPLPAGEGPHALSAALCIYATEAQTYNAFNCVPQSIWAWAEPEQDLVRFRIPKAAIIGTLPPLDERPAGLPRTLDPGSQLTAFQALGARKDDGNSYSSTNRERFIDPVPDDGPASDIVTLRYAAPNTAIRFLTGAAPVQSGFSSVYFRGLPPPDEQAATASLVPGAEARVPLTLQNAAGGKRLVNLSAAVEEGGPAWSVRIASAVELPAGARRTVSLLVNTSGNMDHRSTATMRVEGRSIGHPTETTVMRVHVVAVRPPTVHEPVLYLHSAQGETDDGVTVDVGPFCFGIQGTCGGPVTNWLNVMPDDPMSDAPTVDGFSVIGLLPPEFYDQPLLIAGFPLDAPFPTAPRFQQGTPAALSLELSAEQEFQAVVHGRLEAGLTGGACDGACLNWVPLGTASQSATLGPDGTGIDLDLPIDPAVARDMAAQDLVRLVVEVYGDQWPQRGVATAQEPVRLVLEPSSLRLPLLPPEEGADGASLIGLYPAGDLEEFVNPGEARALNFLVINEGVATQRILVAAEADADGWSATIEPGTRFQLDPGQSVNLTLLAAAPADAAEGARAQVRVTAGPLEGEGPARQLAFQLTATDGVDLPDETETYTQDEETVARLLEEDGGDSSAIGVWAAVAAVAAALWTRRPPGRDRHGAKFYTGNE